MPCLQAQDHGARYRLQVRLEVHAAGLLVFARQPGGTRQKAGPVPAACRHGIQCRSSACKFAHPSKSLVCNSNGGAAEGCDQVTTASTAPSALERTLEMMEEELAVRLIPAGMTLMLLQVSKKMRTAMQRVSPPAMIKVKRGQRPESVKNAMLDMMKWCRITAIDLSYTNINADGVGRLAAVLGQCASLAHLDLRDNEIGAEGAGRLAAVAERCPSLTIYFEEEEEG